MGWVLMGKIQHLVLVSKGAISETHCTECLCATHTAAGLNDVVRGVLDCPAGVTDFHLHHARNLPYPFFHAPEVAAGEVSGLVRVGHGGSFGLGLGADGKERQQKKQGEFVHATVQNMRWIRALFARKYQFFDELQRSLANID